MGPSQEWLILLQFVLPTRLELPNTSRNHFKDLVRQRAYILSNTDLNRTTHV